MADTHAEPAPPLAHRTEDALRRVPIGRSTLYALAKEGRIRPCKLGRITLWPESELVRLMEELKAEANGAGSASAPAA